jgi:hypothetical protein
MPKWELRLDRPWRAALVRTPPNALSHLQITALAGGFFAKMVAA